MSVTQVANTFNDFNGVPVPPTNAESLPNDLAIEFSGEGTIFTTPEAALKGERITASEVEDQCANDT